MGTCIQESSSSNLIVGSKVYLKNLSKKTIALYNKFKIKCPILFCPCQAKKYLPLIIESIEDDVTILNLEGTTGYTVAYISDLGLREEVK